MCATHQRLKQFIQSTLAWPLSLAMLVSTSNVARPQRSDQDPAPKELGCLRLLQVASSPNAKSTDKEAADKCVESIDEERRSFPLRRLANEFTRLATLHFEIPEYHDEQRLSDGAGGLGPQAFIYASPFAGDFKQIPDWEEHGTQGLLVGYVFVFLQPGETIPQTYQDLYLQEGINCLWLARTSAGGWSGGVSLPSADGKCLRSISWTGTLQVNAFHGAFGNYSDFPPVARFSESAEGLPLLGVSCLRAWCELGRPGFTPTPSWVPSAALQNVIKGWSDEQRLVVRNAAGKLVPDVRAHILPIAGIAEKNLADFNNNWITVARIEVKSAPAPGSKYDNWGLRQGTHYLELYRTPAATSAATVASTGADFQARIRRPDGSTKPWQMIKRMPHFDVAMPSTARFRWTIGDDGMWVPCGQACCQVHGPGY